MNTALLIVDVQNDFCPGGALAVSEGDQVIPPLNAVAEAVAARGGLVLASRDWHPADTKHFAAFGGKWPVHCVQNTSGAAFHPALKLPDSAIVISKGTSREDDGYSAFEGRADDGRTLHEVLQARGVQRLLVGGLATDYCVRASVLDALKHGYEVVVLTDAIRGVNLQPDDSERALQEMQAAGARLMTASEALRAL
ncbi:MAG: bifunctional nicotinamidase/pyrazinamidase [Fimbriimonadales bacterium]|nr:bifunctional nicotinamidase/pyrazinamidase [Fimbriimonadales bacterium]MCS7191090.1 bifunctional nicotinamidase/pyrazinamidase [Fimbriimonadales bacterium]